MRHTKSSLRRGFTLIELMIVIAILGILVAIALPRFGQSIHRAQEGATKTFLSSVRTACTLWQGNNGGNAPTALWTNILADPNYFQLQGGAAGTVRTWESGHQHTVVVAASGQTTDGTAAAMLAPTDSAGLYNETDTGIVYIDCSGNTIDQTPIAWHQL